MNIVAPQSTIEDVISRALQNYFAQSQIAIDPALVVAALANFTGRILKTIGEYDRPLASELQVKVAQSIRNIGGTSSASKASSVADFEVQFLAYAAQRDKVRTVAN